MGEQSVRQLRGKAMEDVIFAGTSGIPMMNMAEVSLTLINDNGSAPEALRDFSEIMLTRRIYRSGESAYLINKQPCRLKDIHNVFMGSGMGARSYALIQQGNIGAITEAGPEERRGFIEEAAGTTRYKASKTEALRKLEATRQDMLRLTDILSEVSRQMKSLERQVQKAERYRNTQKKIRRLDIHLSLQAFDRLDMDICRLQALLSEAGKRNDACQSECSRLEAAMAETRSRHAHLHDVLADVQTRQFECRRQIDKLENDMAHGRQEIQRLASEIETLETTRSELEEKTASFDQEIGELEQQADQARKDVEAFDVTLESEKTAYQTHQARLGELKKSRDAAHARLLDLTSREARHQHAYQHACTSLETLKRRLKRADEEELAARKALIESETAEKAAQDDCQYYKDEVIRLTADAESLKQKIHTLRQALTLQAKTTQALDLEKNRMASRYGALKKMADNFEWYHTGVQTVMKAASQPSGSDAPELTGIIGPVADIVNTAPDHEAALAAAMGESLQYLLTADVLSALQAITYLKDRQAGRCGFVPLDAVTPPAEVKDIPANGLIHHIDVRPEYQSVAESLIGHVVLADNLEDAIRMHADSVSDHAVVTPDGQMVSARKMLIGGSSDAASGILVKKNELAALDADIRRVTQELDAAVQTQSALEADVRQEESRLQVCAAEKQAAVQEEMAAEKHAYKAQETLKQARRRLETAQLEQENLGGEDADMEAEVARNQTLLEQIRRETAAVQTEISETADAIQTLTQETEAANQRWMECRLQRTTLNAELENARGTLERLKKFREDAARRMAEISRNIEKNHRKRSDGAVRIHTDEETLQQAKERILGLEETLRNRQAEYDTLEQEMTDTGTRLDDIHQKRNKEMEEIRRIELDLSRLSLNHEHIQTRLTETYHLPFLEIRREAASIAPSDNEPSLEEMEDELNRLRARIAGIGDVNLEAISEYDALKARFEFLEAQRVDLEKAMDDLHKLIQKINRITQERFMETFHAINEKIQEIFPRLFAGGSAQLVLTNPDKPLETGVEFLIQPPGKKLTRISLLSGGEKAMSAIAFIFSIFLIKPAAFCLMDEIDAPLDESNVFRFNDLLKMIGQNSQIVMITHNKHSMSFADTLLGITMEKKGVSKVVSVNLENR
jgi:chromosome segregation protein